MSLSTAAPPMSPLRRYWRDRALWMTIADTFAILVALALPWSTSLVAILVPCWLGAVAWVMDWRAYGRLLKRPICYLPLALVGLALVGTLWSEAAWGARLYAIGPTLKLLALPGLFYHFQRSSRGMWVFIAFLVSCGLVMVMSWIVAYHFAIFPFSSRNGTVRFRNHRYFPSARRKRASISRGSPAPNASSQLFSNLSTSSGWTVFIQPQPSISSLEHPR